MITDDKLVKISYEMDDFLVEQMESNKIEPLNLTAIMLARLIHLNHNNKSIPDFYELLDSVSDKQKLKQEKNKTIQ